MKIQALLVAMVLIGGSVMSPAQDYRHLATVHDGSGVMSTNTVNLGGVDYRHVSAAGQPGGIQTSTNGTLVNHAGFLQAADIKKPSLDTDGDGVIDELDTDNDGDRLSDAQEVEGSGFNPITETLVNNPDTDGDLVPDGDEAGAGTDPTDDSMFLQITDIKTQGRHMDRARRQAVPHPVGLRFACLSHRGGRDRHGQRRRGALV